MRFNPALPLPYSEEWRSAYSYNEGDSPRLSAYQPPGGDPVPFIMENIRLSGGQAVDKAEYPSHGLWSNTSLNEKPHTITINGFVRGDRYIRNRNALVEALRVTTDDVNTGFIDLPLWGRFPVVVESYEVEEKAKENGQCKVSLTFTRAGVTIGERWQFNGEGFGENGRPAEVAESLLRAAQREFGNALEGNALTNSIFQAFTEASGFLLGIIGFVQGPVSVINKMTNAATGITNLVAQGVRSPVELANALFGAIGGIVAGVMEIANSSVDTFSYFKPKRIWKNVLLHFISADKIKFEAEAVTVSQYVSKDSFENLYRTAAYTAAGQIMVQMEMTYQEAEGYWALYENLEKSINQNNPEVSRAVQDMRISVSRELTARRLDIVLARDIPLSVPCLQLSQLLGCGDEKLRRLNIIDDSFVIKGAVSYV